MNWVRATLLNPRVRVVGRDRAIAGRAAIGEPRIHGETKNRSRHLADHLARLPADDSRSRAIIEQMQADEVGHGRAAIAAGGEPLPEPVPRLMRLTARFMTGTAYWI